MEGKNLGPLVEMVLKTIINVKLLRISQFYMVPRLWIHIWLVDIHMCCGEGVTHSSARKVNCNIKQTAGSI